MIGRFFKIIEEPPFFHFFQSALLEGLQEAQELVRRTIPAAPTSERLRFSESLFFQFDVGVEVDLRGIHGLMPKPELRSSASADQGGRPASVAGLQDAD